MYGCSDWFACVMVLSWWCLLCGGCIGVFPGLGFGVSTGLVDCVWEIVTCSVWVCLVVDLFGCFCGCCVYGWVAVLFPLIG